MAETIRRRVRFEVPWRPSSKCWPRPPWRGRWSSSFQCPHPAGPVVLAVSLDPVVLWLERRGVPRTVGAVVVATAIVLLVGAFLWLTWSSLSSHGSRSPAKSRKDASALGPHARMVTRRARLAAGRRCGGDRRRRLPGLQLHDVRDWSDRARVRPHDLPAHRGTANLCLAACVRAAASPGQSRRTAPNRAT